MKILFYGDSVTESGRNFEDKSDLGSGYVKIVAGKLRLLYPERELEFINRGVGGDTTAELLARFDRDLVAEQPDCVVMLIGVNDVWRRFDQGKIITEEQFRANYEELVSRILKTGAKLILVQPFSLNMSDKERFRPYIRAFNQIIREIAEKNNLPVVPMDEIFNGVAQDIKPSQFTLDGVHPTHRGCRYIADNIIKELQRSVL